MSDDAMIKAQTDAKSLFEQTKQKLTILSSDQITKPEFNAFEEAKLKAEAAADKTFGKNSRKNIKQQEQLQQAESSTEEVQRLAEEKAQEEFSRSNNKIDETDILSDKVKEQLENISSHKFTKNKKHQKRRIYISNIFYWRR